MITLKERTGESAMFEDIKNNAAAAVTELIDASGIRSGELMVIGCSSSEILGVNIGKGSSPEAAKAVVEAILPILEEKGILLAAQCCEHLNRALIVERSTAEKFGYEIVSVRPRPKAGGSFATAVYESMSDPVAVESIRASAGLDIGDTLIGMHLKAVAVPLRLSVRNIGQASVHAAKTRPKLIGGARAEYPEEIR